MSWFRKRSKTQPANTDMARPDGRTPGLAEATELLLVGAQDLMANAERIHYSRDPEQALRELVQNIRPAAQQLTEDLEREARTPEVQSYYPQLSDRIEKQSGAILLEVEYFLLHAVDRVAFALLSPSLRDPVVDFVFQRCFDTTLDALHPDAEMREALKSAMLGEMNERSREYASLKAPNEGLNFPGYVSGWVMNKCAANMTAVADPQAAQDPIVTVPMTIRVGLMLTILNVQEAVDRVKEAGKSP